MKLCQTQTNRPLLPPASCCTCPHGRVVPSSRPRTATHAYTCAFLLLVLYLCHPLFKSVLHPAGPPAPFRPPLRRAHVWKRFAAEEAIVYHHRWRFCVRDAIEFFTLFIVCGDRTCVCGGRQVCHPHRRRHRRQKLFFTRVIRVWESALNCA